LSFITTEATELLELHLILKLYRLVRRSEVVPPGP